MMERFETESADIHITIYTECPKCEEDIDLMEIEPLTDEGEIHKKALGDTFGGENLNLTYKCPECGVKLVTNKVTW